MPSKPSRSARCAIRTATVGNDTPVVHTSGIGADTTGTVPPMTVDDLLADARRGLQRLTPEEAARARRDGAMLVDIRPLEQRRADGDVPGAVRVDRNVLEWRLDPACPHRLPEVDAGRRVVLVCNEGYATSLAAATLQQLGLDATDVIGGFQAWRAAGLPVTPPAL
jgi:rhodanese-related sulfurtransferase